MKEKSHDFSLMYDWGKLKQNEIKVKIEDWIKGKIHQYNKTLNSLNQVKSEQNKGVSW